MNLELKHIVGYLPYKLECKYKNWEKPFQIVGTSGNALLFERDWTRLLTYPQSHLVSLEFIKPILRPMSDLHKEINGKIHLLELYAMASMGIYNFNFTISEDGVLDDLRNERSVRWAKDVNKLYIDDYYKGKSKGGYYIVSIEIIEYLYKNHFDIYGLIEQNLAIDINTLKQ